MSFSEITNIASEYCSRIIELNLLLTNAISKNEPLKINTVNGDTVLYDSKDCVTNSYARQRADLLKNVREALKNLDDFENLNDEQLNRYLFEIYCDKLDNDKYGINKRS